MTYGSGYSGGGGSRGGPGGPPGAGARPGGMFRRFGRGRKACTFCVEKIETIDYKSANRLRRYLSDRSRVESGKRTGTCARHQRVLRLAIKRARFMAMLPYAPGHLRVTGPVSLPGKGPAQSPQAAEDVGVAEPAGAAAEQESDAGEDDVLPVEGDEAAEKSS